MTNHSSGGASDDPFRFRLRAFAGWLLRVARRKFLRKSQGRFALVSPSYARVQQLDDAQLQQTLAIPIRDKVDLEVINQIFLREDYRLKKLARCHEINGWYQKILANQRTPLIIDLGANTGLASLYFSREFPEASILAVEPSAENSAIARRNTAACAKVSVIEAGISSNDGMGEITNPGADNWAFRTEIKSDGKLKMISVPTLLAQQAGDGAVPFIAKIDIEGFESILFEGNLDWFDRFPLVIIELHDWMLPGQANSRNFLRCVSALDRDFVYRSENVFSIKNNVSAADLQPLKSATQAARRSAAPVE